MSVEFQIKEGDLAEQLRKLKLQNQSKELQIEKWKAEDPEFQDLKKKI